MNTQDFVILDGPVGWSDDYDGGNIAVELDGFMIEDLKTYRDGLFSEMLAIFERQVPEQLRKIESSLASSDFGVLVHAAHELAEVPSTSVAAASPRTLEPSNGSLPITMP